MTRKAKQPGGHNPLTYHERSKLTSYGTKTARLGSECHAKFGDCCLGLTPATDPVATPSGHIYSREAILSYLLTKNQELKKARVQYERQLSIDQNRINTERQEEEEKQIEKFTLENHNCSTQISKEVHAKAHKTSLGRKIDTESTDTLNKSLKRTSYWLSESQPQYTKEAKEEEIRNNPPPKRPPSPMSGRPLKLKDLIAIQLHRDSGDGGDTNRNDGVGRCICPVSNKTISTQPVVLIKKTGIVLLKDIFDQLRKSSGNTCPITGKKFKDKDVITLIKGTSGFSASGNVVAKKYRPTLT